MNFKIFVVIRENEEGKIASWWNGSTFVDLSFPPLAYSKQDLNSAYKIAARFQAEVDYEVRLIEGSLSFDFGFEEAVVTEAIPSGLPTPGSK